MFDGVYGGKSRTLLAVVLLVLILASACADGEMDEPVGPHRTWCDPETALCWQDPPKSPTYDDTGLVPSEAVRYCAGLRLGGFDDWRVPTIDELRTIVAGSPESLPEGGCAVTAGASMAAAMDPACLGGPAFEGPGANGCYWKAGLTGLCDKPDPAVHGHPLETWALDPAVDDPTRWVAYATFDTGAVGFNHACSLGDVRCVRNAHGGPPPACEVAGRSCASHLPSAEHCEQDFTGQADTLELHISLPADLGFAPHQLMAFLYESAPGWYPPFRPPDGGTDQNQVIGPVFVSGESFVLKLPGTTYYREELLQGDFQLYVHVQMVERFPPIPAEDDYVWGQGRTPIRFPFDGVEHRGGIQELAVTLEPLRCPVSTPHRCPDRTCVTSEDACPPTECDTVPDDSQVITCRYASDFEPNNCADFPIAGGWTRGLAEAHCKSLLGAMPESVEVRQADSCMRRAGGFATATRCRAEEQERLWWAYGAPQFVCEVFLQGTHEDGPFCAPYDGL